MNQEQINAIRDFSAYLWDMDRLKLTTQLPPFEDSDKMVDYYLMKNSILDKEAYKRFDNKNIELAIGIRKFYNCGTANIKSALVICNYNIESSVALLKNKPWKVGNGKW